jgi:hypothetical protein
MNRCSRLLTSSFAAAAILACAAHAQAYESDVHYGLTRWLALRAGYTPSQADAIATADLRVDGGLVETTQLGLEYACAGRFASVAKLAQDARYPAARAVPAAPADRAVQAGGAAARAALDAAMKVVPGQEGLMLGRFGRALHPLQDSWAHQGTPSTPHFGAILACDASLASGHPAARGGADSHAADLTRTAPAEVLAMAAATYDALLRYGRVEGQPRTPVAWDAMVAPVQAFAQARTKTEKRTWFNAQGMHETGFLAGTSLPDGSAPGPSASIGRMLPPVPGDASMQHDAPADARKFFDTLLARWLSAERVEDVVAALGPAARASGPDAASAELVARLKLWKLRDHGSAAELAHAPAPLDSRQRQRVDKLTRGGAGYLAPMRVADAVVPLQPSTPAPMPMLPYIVRELAPSGELPRVIAIARLRHAPYDTVGWIAERRASGWVLTAMVSTVDQ